jgi:hypothetical protein
MRASVISLFALALVGAAACGEQRAENKSNENSAAQPSPGEQTQQQTQVRERTEEKHEAGVAPTRDETQEQEQQKAAAEKKAEEAKAQAGAKAKAAEDRADQLRKDADAKADKLKKDAEARCDQLKKNADAEADRIKKAAEAKADRLEHEKTAAPAKARQGGTKHAVTGKRTKAKERERAGLTHPAEPTGQTTITEAEVPRGRAAPPEQQPTAPEGALPPVSEQPGGQPYVNHSTVLGDGTSGTYTDGQGTYGGRATWGTGTPR